MKLRARLLLAAALLAAASCQVEDPEEPAPVRPDCYLTLLDVYDGGEKFVSASFKDVSTVLEFEITSLQLLHTELEVHDCSSTNHPPIYCSVGDDHWYVSGQKTNIPRTSGYSARESYPVYLYLYEETLHMYISNGDLLDFPKYSAEPEPTKPQEYTMPVLRITHSSDRVHRNSFISATLAVEDPDAHYSDVTSVKLPMQIRGRGQSTWGMPKQPYKIKLNEKSKVLGMRSNRDWILLANYADKSLMRNAVAMRTSEILEMPWTPAHIPVEVYLNGVYQGVYDLFEGKEVAKHKVDIDVENGDYYIEVEQNDYDFTTTKCNVPINFKDPEREEITTDQFNYIKDLFNGFETALYSNDFKDPDKGYAAWIDVESFVNNYIVEELSKDIDGNVRKSSFLTVAAEDAYKIKFYHEWDFDLAYGNADYFPGGQTGAGNDSNGPKGWWIKDYNTDSWKGPGWYNQLFKDPAFVQKVKDRWNEVYSELATVPDYVDFCVTEMGDAPARNFTKWNILKTYVWPNVFVSGTYQQHVDYMKDFYTQRLEWLNININGL